MSYALTPYLTMYSRFYYFKFSLTFIPIFHTVSILSENMRDVVQT